MSEKRRDNRNRILREGEYQRKDGRYRFRYIDEDGKEKNVYSWRLDKNDPMPKGKKREPSLREKEKQIEADLFDRIVTNGGNYTVLELVEKYVSLKTGVRHNTVAGYKTVINMLKKESFGNLRIDKVRLSDAKEWLIKLQQIDRRGYSSIHSIRGVLRPAFQMAVDDDLLRKNPFEFELASVIVNDSVTREAITRKQQRDLLKFIQEDKHFSRYYDAIYILFHTGLRISEFCGLTVSEIEFGEMRIKVDHQLQRTAQMQYIMKLRTEVMTMRELIDTYTTDENGQFTTKYYVCGDDWTIREISPSEGYLLDPTIHKVGAEPELYEVEYNSAKNDVNEQVIKGNIAIIKHTDDGETGIETPEEGAVFEVFLKSAGGFDQAKESERDKLVCDENGFAQTKDMPYGIYTVKQTSGWEGRELMKPFDVFISSDGQTYRYLINNANFESYIKVVKKDAETGKTIPYAGAGFQIYDPNGNLVTMTFTYPEVTTIDTFYTTADGELVTPEALEYGKGYSLVEVQAPYGYVLDSEPVYFDVVQENSEEESGITVIEVVRSNLAQKGTITVEKSGEIFSSVSENNGMYQPNFAVGNLEGAVYEIIAAEDIVTLEGTVRAKKGEVVDTLTTGADGTAKSKELYLGKYEVKEVTAPNGMVLNDEIHSVELVYAGQEISVTETETSFYNERQRVEIDLVKSLETDEHFGVGNNGEIFDVAFGLYAENELTAADGTVIPADGLIEIITLDENGNGKVKTDLPMGNYYVKEIAANEAYLTSDTKYPVNFEYAGQDTAIVHLAVNDGEPIENKLIYGSVSGKKTDEDGKGLGGAVIGIFKTGTEEFTKEHAILTTTSKDDGSFSFAKVPYGSWIIREVESPKGFVLSEEEIPVTIGKVDEVVEIELVNEFITGNIELTKVDKDYPDNKLTGAVFEVFADTNKNGEYDKEDELLGEMSELGGGIYQMSELRYGKYFVREKTAPEGFLLDENVYTVSIEENGKTYVVENEAGKGFVNAPQSGSLKIVKTSSDGKVEGFSFRVTGANGYDQTFKTDKNGEIVIENLRIGEYTISEVSDKASANYILPAEKQITVKVGSTTVVQMHNELRDTPKTGDDFNPFFWGGLAAISLIGAGTLLIAGLKKKKD